VARSTSTVRPSHPSPCPTPTAMRSICRGFPGRRLSMPNPMTGRPDMPLPDGWDMIPGARGCTPQSCAFRDHYAELVALGVEHLFGLFDAGHQLPNRGCQPAAPAIPSAVRCPARNGTCPSSAYDGRGRYNALETPNPRHRGRADRQGVLSGLSTRPKRSGRDGMVRDEGAELSTAMCAAIAK